MADNGEATGGTTVTPLPAERESERESEREPGPESEPQPALGAVDGADGATAHGEEHRTLPPDTQPGRVRHLVTRGRLWTDTTRTRVMGELEERRGRSAIIGAGFDTLDLDVGVGGGILAGAVAFRLFLFLVPFVYIVFTVFGFAARSASQDPEQLAKTVGITGVLASAIVNAQHISPLSQVLLLLGAAGALFLTANSLVKTMFVVHWLVWRVPRVKPSGIRAILAVVGLALAMTVLSVAINDLRTVFGIVGSLLVTLIVVGGSFALWWWVSWQLPHAPVPASRLIPGAVFVAAGTVVMHLLTTYWIGHLVARKSHTYGAVGIALAVLFWVYVFGRFLVGSASLNATLWRRSEHEGQEAADRADGAAATAT